MDVSCYTSGNQKLLKLFLSVSEISYHYLGPNNKQAQIGLVFLFPKWSNYDKMERVKF